MEILCLLVGGMIATVPSPTTNTRNEYSSRNAEKNSTPVDFITSIQERLGDAKNWWNYKSRILSLRRLSDIEQKTVSKKKEMQILTRDTIRDATKTIEEYLDSILYDLQNKVMINKVLASRAIKTPCTKNCLRSYKKDLNIHDYLSTFEHIKRCMPCLLHANISKTNKKIILKKMIQTIRTLKRKNNTITDYVADATSAAAANDFYRNRSLETKTDILNQKADALNEKTDELRDIILDGFGKRPNARFIKNDYTDRFKELSVTITTLQKNLSEVSEAIKDNTERLRERTSAVPKGITYNVVDVHDAFDVDVIPVSDTDL